MISEAEGTVDRAGTEGTFSGYAVGLIWSGYQLRGDMSGFTWVARTPAGHDNVSLERFCFELIQISVMAGFNPAIHPAYVHTSERLSCVRRRECDGWQGQALP
jgi:hypothetical protein